MKTLFKADRNIQNVFVLFLYFMTVSFVMVTSKYTFVNDVDDWILWSYLIASEPKIMIMSYPLATVISFLYDYFPEVQWYSITVFFYISLISLLFSVYIARLHDTYLKLLTVVIATVILVHVWLQVSVTILTLLLLAVSVPLIRRHQIGFWVLLLLASFLRVGIIFSLLPFFILIYLILFEKKYFTVKRILVVLALACMVLLNYSAPSFDKEYKEWLHYNKARAYFADLKGKDKKNILSEDEEYISYIWYANDDVLLSTEKIIEASGSLKDVLFDTWSMTFQSFRDIIAFLWHKEQKHKLLIFLIFLTLYIMYKERSNPSRMFYLLFIVGFFVATLLRDNDRGFFPIIVAWGILIFIKLLDQRKDLLLKGFLSIAVPLWIIDLPVDRVLNYKVNEKLKNEFIQLINKYPGMTYEVSESFPRELNTVGYVFMQSHIFDEKNWVNPVRDHILFPSWTARNPYAYDSHHISFDGKKREYGSFYEFLTDEHVGFIGSRKVNKETNDVILKMYNKKYAQHKTCYHMIKVIDESEHFSITKLIQKCDK